MVHKAVIGAALSLCVAACVSSPVTPAAAHAAANRAPAGCVAQTATRIPLRPDECGAAGQALYLLDPTLPAPSILGKPRMASR